MQNDIKDEFIYIIIMDYNKYNESKIYKLQGNDGYFYIGSTTQNLCARLCDHRRSSERPEYKNTKVYKHFNNLGWNNVKIIELKRCKLNDLSELLGEEDKFIQPCLDDPLCLNMKLNFKIFPQD